MNFLGVEWLGPVPDPNSFTPLAMPQQESSVGHSQKELFAKLEELGHITQDFSIPNDVPTGPPR